VGVVEVALRRELVKNDESEAEWASGEAAAWKGGSKRAEKRCCPRSIHPAVAAMEAMAAAMAAVAAEEALRSASVMAVTRETRRKTC